MRYRCRRAIAELMAMNRGRVVAVAYFGAQAVWVTSGVRWVGARLTLDLGNFVGWNVRYQH